MKPNISEFSYGYALTDELVHTLPGVTAAPVFPSLYQEGQKGGGYDVKIKSCRIPLFIQFKLSDQMIRKTAQEHRDEKLICPFYRMHLRPARHSRQHELLFDLEESGELVYYAAPAFHEPAELDTAFLNQNVVSSSVWIRPSAIGRIEDDDKHHVAFQLMGKAFFYSTPRQITQPIDSKDMIRRLNAATNVRTSSTDIQISRALETLVSLSERHAVANPNVKTLPAEAFANRHPIERLAFESRRILNAQLYLLERQK